LAVVFVAASIAIIFGVRYVYMNYYQPYANLTVAQADPRLFEPWPPYAEYSNMPEGVLEKYPKLKGAFDEVNDEFRRVVSECPPRELVYCDLASNARVTSTISANELDSILSSEGLDFYSTRPYGEWIAFVVVDECYIAIPLLDPEELATANGNGNGKCYYTIKLELIY
ncbi:MAG: hypothetical protein ACRD5H_05835, partial [Nitrososphaerales archaeon]